MEIHVNNFCREVNSGVPWSRHGRSRDLPFPRFNGLRGLCREVSGLEELQVFDGGHRNARDFECLRGTYPFTG